MNSSPGIEGPPPCTVRTWGCKGATCDTPTGGQQPRAPAPDTTPSALLRARRGDTAVQWELGEVTQRQPIMPPATYPQTPRTRTATKSPVSLNLPRWTKSEVRSGVHPSSSPSIAALESGADDGDRRNRSHPNEIEPPRTIARSLLVLGSDVGVGADAATSSLPYCITWPQHLLFPLSLRVLKKWDPHVPLRALVRAGLVSWSLGVAFCRPVRFPDIRSPLCRDFFLAHTNPAVQQQYMTDPSNHNEVQGECKHICGSVRNGAHITRAHRGRSSEFQM